MEPLQFARQTCGLPKGLAPGREPSNSWAMNDRDVYLKLAAVAEELQALSEVAETIIGKAALSTMANTVAGAAKAVYEHALGGEEH